MILSFLQTKYEKTFGEVPIRKGLLYWNIVAIDIVYFILTNTEFVSVVTSQQFVFKVYISHFLFLQIIQIEQ